MKMYIFVCAFDDSGLDVEVQGVYKSEEKAIEGMMDYFVDTCNYNEDDAKDVVNELLIERYYEETGDDFDVQAVYRLKVVHIQFFKWNNEIVGLSDSKTPTPYCKYMYAREDYLLNDRLNANGV